MKSVPLKIEIEFENFIVTMTANKVEKGKIDNSKFYFDTLLIKK